MRRHQELRTDSGLSNEQGPSASGADHPAMTDAASIRAQTTNGVAWSAVQKWAIRLTGFASVALMARLLDAQDFGLVAAATAMMPLLYLLSDLGFSTYVVQAERVDQRMLSTAFWFSASAGVVMGLALVVAAPFVADALSIEGLDSVLRVMAIAVVAAALGSAPTAILKRRMAFRAFAVQSGIASVAGQVVAVVCALIGWGVWALVAQLVVAQVLVCVLVWFAARWVPQRGFSLSELRKMARFGASVVGIEIIAILRSWAENGVIAVTLGVTGLGYLNIAQRLIQVAQDLTVSSVTPVTTVAFAKIREGAERLRAAYRDVVEVTYAVAIPFVAGLAVAGPLIIPLVFGDGWSKSVAPSQVWALASLMVVGAVVDHSLFYGMGRPHTWLVYALVVDAVTLGVTVVAVRFGLLGVAVGFACVAAAALVARTVLVSRVLRVRYTSVAAPFARAVVVLGCTSLVVWGVVAVTPGLPDVVRLVLAAVAAAGCYWLVLRYCMPRAAITVQGLVLRLTGGFRGRLAVRSGR